MIEHYIATATRTVHKKHYFVKKFEDFIIYTSCPKYSKDCNMEMF